MKKSSKHRACKALFALITAVAAALPGCGNNGTGAADGAFVANTAPKTDAAAVSAVLQEDITGEITISSFMDYGFLDKVVTAFENKYPGVKVNVERPDLSLYSNSYEDAQAQQAAIEQAVFDYIGRVNTEIMSGGGPDILQIDVVPWYVYADGGYLEDLRVYMDTDKGFNKEDIRMNIIDAVSYKGGTYTLPINFYFYFFAYDATFFNDEEREAIAGKDAFTFNELAEIAEDAFARNGGKNYMFGLTGGKGNSLFGPLLTESYGSFADTANRRANFGDGRFESLLLSVNEYAEKGYITDDPEVNKARFENTYPTSEPDERFFYKHEYVNALMRKFFKDIDWARYLGAIPSNGATDNDVVAGLAADYNGNIPCNPENMYALNSNSRNKRLAWEFLKFMTSEEPQIISGMLGVFPLNKTLFEEKAMSDLTLWGIMSFEITDENEQTYNDYIACLNGFADKLNTCIILDVRIYLWVEDEAAQYFDGKKTAKEAAAALQNKVHLYLSE